MFKRVKAAKAKISPQESEAKRVLLEHFEATGTDKFEGIGLAVDTREQLDTARVRVFLGDKVEEFTKTVTSRTLSVLEEP